MRKAIGPSTMYHKDNEPAHSHQARSTAATLWILRPRNSRDPGSTNIIVVPQQPSYSLQSPDSLFRRAEKDVEDPFRLDYNAQVGRVSPLALLVGGRLDDGDGGNPVEAEAPFVGVNGFGELCWPGFRVEGAECFEEAPVDVLIVLHGPGVRRKFAKDDERGVGPQLAGLR